MRIGFITIISFLLSQWVFAGSDNKRVNYVTTKSSLEEMITHRYHERIGTQLPPEMFNVSVQVTLQLKKMPKSTAGNNSGEAADGNSTSVDMTLGIIKKIGEGPSHLTKKSDSEIVAKSLPEELILKYVEVTIGLSQNLGKEYQKKIQNWAETQVQNEFGADSKVTVVDMVPLPKEKVPTKVISFHEKFGNYQNAVGFSVIGLIFLIATLLMKYLPSRDTKEQLAVSLRLQEMKTAQALLLSENKPSALSAPNTEKKISHSDQLSPQAIFENFKDHQKKVALIAFLQNSLINSAFKSWTDHGLEGRQKMAIFIDSMFSFYDHMRTEKDSGFNLNWDIPAELKNDRKLAEAFSTLQEMSLSDKTKLLEKTYWDLVSLKTIGATPAKSAFAVLENLSNGQIQKLLENKDKKIQSLAIMHLSPEKISQVIASYSFEEKGQLLLKAFETPQIKAQELDLVEESLKLFMKQNLHKESDSVELSALISNFLMGLNPQEELLLLRQLPEHLKDQRRDIKEKYPSIAFIGEWPNDTVKLFVSSLGSHEVHCLALAAPEIEAKIFDYLADHDRATLEDALKNNLEENDYINGLESLRLILFRLVNNGQIQMETLFSAGNLRVLDDQVPPSPNKKSA